VTYVKPLNNSMGPKQTKCILTEQVLAHDFNSAFVALVTTSTPDVPSGSSFQVLTKYCMTWAGGPSTRILITCTVEWSKSSWIKGAIEKGVNDGQLSFAKDLVREIRKKLEGEAPGGKKKANGKRKSGKRKKEESRDEEKPAEEIAQRSGLVGNLLQMGESLGDILGPVVKSLFSWSGLISILLVLVLFALIRVERTMRNLSSGNITPGRPESSVREPALQNTDGDSLWDWIDSRIEKVSKDDRDGRVIWNTLVSEGLVEQGLEKVEDVIRTTEGKLQALKGVVEKRKARNA